MRNLLAGLAVVCAVAAACGVVRGQCEGRFVGVAGRGIAGVNGYARQSVEWDSDGDGPLEPWLVVAGAFSIAGDVTANNIATWDGARWRALGTGLPGAVWAVEVYRGGLYAVAEFPGATGLGTQLAVARFDGDTWTRIPGTNDTMRLAAFNGELALGLYGQAVKSYNGVSVRTLGLFPAQGWMANLASLQGALYAVSADRAWKWNGAS